MSLHTALGCVAVLLAIGPAAIAFSRSHCTNSVVYGASLAISTAIAATALLALLTLGDAKETQVLPLGLPWLGAHFRLDNLSAFFLLVINFGGASASLFALGYGRHEDAPQRVLPFYPVFIAAMNLVVLSDDAFTFLVSWEFMSLTSWALVLAHHEQPENVQAGFVYLVMASFGRIEPHAIPCQEVSNARRMDAQRHDHGRGLRAVVGNLVARTNLHRRPL